MRWSSSLSVLLTAPASFGKRSRSVCLWDQTPLIDGLVKVQRADEGNYNHVLHVLQQFQCYLRWPNKRNTNGSNENTLFLYSMYGHWLIYWLIVQIYSIILKYI